MNKMLNTKEKVKPEADRSKAGERKEPVGRLEFPPAPSRLSILKIQILIVIVVAEIRNQIFKHRKRVLHYDHRSTFIHIL